MSAPHAIPSTPIMNISCYLFAPLRDLKPLRAELKKRCGDLALKGSILLSQEGINLFVAGRTPQVEELVSFLKAQPGLEDLRPKVSFSEHQPFNRMLVKIKQEIIAFGVPGINPAERTSPKLAPAELRRWLDEGREVVLLDTRNEYEVKLGTFQNALPMGIHHFRDFPQAVQSLPEKLKEKPIVMFCTGGIRCEKAGPFMESQGFRNVHQLDGGILKYFEECGDAHYQGTCFVFDQRVGVDPTLTESGDTQCYACLAPLKREETSDPRYSPGKSCPHCYRTPEDSQAKLLEQRHTALIALCRDLPGAKPYLSKRPIRIAEKHRGLTALTVLTQMFPQVEESYWHTAFAQGRLVDSAAENAQPLAATSIVSPGTYLHHLIPNVSEPAVATNIEIVYEDQAVVVVNKPAPLPMHPCGRYNRNTLQYLLNQVYRPTILRAAHRLDANTSGLVVFAKTKRIAGLLQPQFSRGEVQKLYHAKVLGHPAWESYECALKISETPREAGAREVTTDGLNALTLFKVVKRCPDGTSLIEARPITGRTNQIRIHLWALGHPIVGDRLYLPENKLGTTQTLGLDNPPLELRAVEISFVHPIEQRRTAFRL